MRSTPKVRRVLALSSAALCIALAVLFASGIAPIADTKPAGTLGINAVTKSVAEVSGLSDGDGKADPGETLEYTISITGNASPTTGVTLNDTLSSLTTLTGSANILPNARDNAFDAIGNVPLVMPDDPANDLLANDVDLDGGTITLTGFGDTLATANANAAGTTANYGAASPLNGASLTVNANGSFNFNPPRGFSGTQKFYYSVSDGQGGTDTAEVNITVNGTIWFINPAAAADGDGRFTSPYKNLGTFNTTNILAGGGANPDNGDTIFLYSGNHAATLSMRASQKVIGQGATDSIVSITGYTAPSGSNQLPSTGGTSPVITTSANGIELNANNTIRGLTIGNVNSYKILGTNFGTLTVGRLGAPDVTLTGTGQALRLQNGSFASTSAFSSVANTGNNIGEGILLTSISGAVSFGSTNVIAQSSSPGISVSQSTVDLNFGNTAVAAGTNGVVLQNNSAGTRTFGTLSISGGTGIGFLHASSGGAVTAAGLTTITNPQGTGFSVDSSNANLSFAGLTVNKPNTNGTAVNIVNSTGRTFSFGNLNITTLEGAGIVTAFGGTINSTGGSITAGGFLNGLAASFANTILNLTFTSVSSAGGANGLVFASGTSGSFTSGTTNLQNSTAVGLSMNTSAVNANFGNTTVNSSGNTAVSLASNTGTITFADLDLTPDANQRGLDATNNTKAITATSGDVTVTGAPAVNISGPAGRTPLNLQFTRVSANGGANGIILRDTSTTGSPGGFRILGNSAGLCGGVSNPTGAATAPNAADCTGGTIQNTTGADGATSGNGIYLANVENVSFTRIRVNDHQNNGVFGTGVRGLTIASSLFNGNNGTSNSGTFDESAVSLVDLGGTVSITNSFISGGAFNNLRIENTSGTSPNLSLALNGNTSGTMQGSTADVRSTAFLVNATDGTAASQINNNRLTVWWGNAIHVLIQGTASGTSNITGNFADNTNGAVAGAGGIWVGGGTHTYNISNNIVRHTNGTPISADRVNAGTTMQGTIDSNTIGVSGDPNSGSSTGIGIFAGHHGPGTTTVRISNNTLRQINGSANGAITTLTGDAAAFGGSGTMNATIIGNNIQESGTTVNSAQHGILITHGITSTAPGDSDQGCYDIGGSTPAARNTITNFNMGSAPTAQNRIRVNQRFNTTSRFPGFTGTATGSTSQTDLAAYLLARNNASNSANVNTSTGGFLNTSPAGSACPQPASPPSSFAEAEFVNEQASIYETYGIGAIDAGIAGPIAEQELQPTDAAPADVAAGNSAYEFSFLGFVSEIAGKLGEVISPAASAAPAFAGESVTKGPFTLPANETVTIKFRVTVESGPYAAGVDEITNIANITADGGINLTSNTSSIELDAAPDLSVTVAANPATTEPGKTVTFVTTAANGDPANAQGATGVTLTQTVPANTIFNATASGAGWSCADGSPAGTTCDYTVGSLAVNASASANFAVDVLSALPAGADSVVNSASISDDGANGADLNGFDNASNTETTPIIGNWLGATSTDWHVASNWSNNTVPPAGNNISVPNAANRPEIVSQDATVGILTLGRNIRIGSGRTLTANGNVTLGTNVVDGAGTLELAAAAEISRTTGQVEAALKKNFAAPGTFVFPVGTAGAYSPANVNVTAGTGSLSVRARTGTVPSTPPVDPAKTLQRYWSLDGSGITADLTFNYLQTDVVGTEGAYRLLRVAGGVPQSFANAAGCPASGSPCVDPTANTIFAAGISAFSDWTASELAPTSAPASITGQVFGYEGRVNGGALVVLTDDAGNVHYAKANTFGYFRFVNIDSGKTYVISVIDKRHRYTASTVNLDADVAGLMLVPQQP